MGQPGANLPWCQLVLPVWRCLCVGKYCWLAQEVVMGFMVKLCLKVLNTEGLFHTVVALYFMYFLKYK